MAKVQKSKLALIISIVFIPIILIGLLVIHWFVYPFTSASPNFADVESTFNKLQIPSDWQVIDESENRGIAGRQCPIESGSLCFHKADTYSVPMDTSAEQVKRVVLSSGCISAVRNERATKDSSTRTTEYECSAGGVIVVADLKFKDGQTTTYVSTRSQ